MIDVKRIRAQPEEMRDAIRKRHVNRQQADLDRWLQLDERKRRLELELEGLSGERNKLAQIGRTDPEAARQAGQELRRRSREIEDQLAQIGEEWQSILDWLPNWPEAGMPEGAGEEDNVEEKVWIPGSGYLETGILGTGTHSARFMPPMPVHAQENDFVPLHHLDLGRSLGGIDTEQAAQVSGSRFTYILGD